MGFSARLESCENSHGGKVIEKCEVSERPTMVFTVVLWHLCFVAALAGNSERGHPPSKSLPYALFSTPLPRLLKSRPIPTKVLQELSVRAAAEASSRALNFMGAVLCCPAKVSSAKPTKFQYNETKTCCSCHVEHAGKLPLESKNVEGSI